MPVSKINTSGNQGVVKTDLGPKCQVALADKVPREPRHRHSGPHVREVVDAPIAAAEEGGRNVDLAEELDMRELPLEQPDGDDEDSAHGEAQQEPLVGGAGAEGLARADGPPHDGGGEEGVLDGALEAHGRFGGTDVGEAHLRSY